MRRQTSLAPLLLCSPFCLPILHAQTAPDYKSDPKFQAAIAEGKSSGTSASITPEVLLQGPFSDAMTHAGQLALLRRLSGSPVAPENFIFADISPENLGSNQPPPRSPDKNWPEKP